MTTFIQSFSENHFFPRFRPPCLSIANIFFEFFSVKKTEIRQKSGKFFFQPEPEPEPEPEPDFEAGNPAGAGFSRISGRFLLATNPIIKLIDLGVRHQKNAVSIGESASERTKTT